MTGPYTNGLGLRAKLLYHSDEQPERCSDCSAEVVLQRLSFISGSFGMTNTTYGTILSTAYDF